MLTPPALHHLACLPNLWACLPHQHSTTWHACLMCGHAYPTGTLPCGMVAGSVGMLTQLALCPVAWLPDMWACLPIRSSGLNHACLSPLSMLAQLAHHPSIYLPHICGDDMTPPFPVVQLSGMLASLSNVCWTFPLSMHVPFTVDFDTVCACVLVIIDLEPLTHLMPLEDLQAYLNILRGHCSFYLGCPFSLLPTVAIDTRYNLTCIPPVSGPVFVTILPSPPFFFEYY